MKKILIVDDSRLFRQEAEFILRSEGYEVLSADDGNEGFGSAQKNRPDLIILDLIMPEVDGLLTCMNLKKDRRTKNIPIIMCTSHNPIESIDKAKDAGAIDFIAKPVNFDMLKMKITKILGG